MISIEDHGPVRTILLDREKSRNAMTPALLTDLAGAIGSVPTTARAIVLGGNGPVFSAGFDLKLCQTDPAAMLALLSGLVAVIAALRAAPMPVVLAAHGAAIAGACALIGAADLTITNDDARLGYPVVRMGLSPAVSAPGITAVVEPGVARALMLDPGLISGRRALQLGLVARSLPTADAVLPEALRVATDLAAKPAGAILATRRWLDEIDRSTSIVRTGRADWVGRALEASERTAQSPEHRQRLAAINL